MLFRVGIPKLSGQIARTLHRLRQPGMVSAGALWRPDREQFASPGLLALRMELALDSGGYVAATRGGFPWTVEQFVTLACAYGWDWWSQMDLPCEKALAPNQAAVRARVEETARLLELCLLEARRQRGDSGRYPWMQDPVPVLQGRRPDDYAYSAELATKVMGGKLPNFVGIGSMCTRHVNGPDGILAIVDALDQILPKNTQFHLYGVKGDALPHLKNNPRVRSCDSMAWDDRARWAAFAEGRPSARVKERVNHMLHFTEVNLAHIR